MSVRMSASVLAVAAILALGGCDEPDTEASAPTDSSNRASKKASSGNADEVELAVVADFEEEAEESIDVSNLDEQVESLAGEIAEDSE